MVKAVSSDKGGRKKDDGQYVKDSLSLFLSFSPSVPPLLFLSLSLFLSLVLSHNAVVGGIIIMVIIKRVGVVTRHAIIRWVQLVSWATLSAPRWKEGETAD